MQICVKQTSSIKCIQKGILALWLIIVVFIASYQWLICFGKCPAGFMYALNGNEGVSGLSSHYLLCDSEAVTSLCLYKKGSESRYE